MILSKYYDKLILQFIPIFLLLFIKKNINYMKKKNIYVIEKEFSINYTNIDPK